MFSRIRYISAPILFVLLVLGVLGFGLQSHACTFCGNELSLSLVALEGSPKDCGNAGLSCCGSSCCEEHSVSTYNCGDEHGCYSFSQLIVMPAMPVVVAGSGDDVVQVKQLDIPELVFLCGGEDFFNTRFFSELDVFKEQIVHPLERRFGLSMRIFYASFLL